MLLLLALPSIAFAVTQQDCTNQLGQCIQSTCTQAGCELSGTECYCTPAEEAQWDALTDAQCQAPYLACIQQASGGSSSGGSGSCCGSAFILAGLAFAGILFASKR